MVRFLTKSVYAGYVSAPRWGVSRRDGHHQGIVSKATFERIKQRLNEGVYAPTREDIKADFPLRGAVCCASCKTPLTAGWCKGKYKKYPYYFCRKRGCDLYGKMIARNKIEGAFIKLLAELRPSETMFELVRAMFKDAWTQKAAQINDAARTFRTQALEIEQSIDEIVDLAANAKNPRLIARYESRIEKLETEKLLLQEKAENYRKPEHTFEQLFELCMRFLSNPCKLWETGRFEMQRLVLRLTFSGHLQYCRKNGFLNTELSLPFRALGGISGAQMWNGAAGVT